MPRPDKSNKIETISTPIVDEVYTDEDIVRQQEYKIESLQNEINSLREQTGSPPTDETELRLYEMTRELMSAHQAEPGSYQMLFKKPKNICKA